MWTLKALHGVGSISVTVNQAHIPGDLQCWKLKASELLWGRHFMAIFCFPRQANLNLSPTELDSLGLTSETDSLSQQIANLSENAVDSFLKRLWCYLVVGFILGNLIVLGIFFLSRNFLFILEVSQHLTIVSDKSLHILIKNMWEQMGFAWVLAVFITITP